MDLPFQNNDPQPASQDAGSDFWNFDGKPADASGFGDDVTLNELLALYQSANEAAPPFAPMNEPEAYPPAADPIPFAPSTPVQSMPWETPEAVQSAWEVPEPAPAIAFEMPAPEPTPAVAFEMPAPEPAPAAAFEMPAPEPVPAAAFEMPAPESAPAAAFEMPAPEPMPMPAFEPEPVFVAPPSVPAVVEPELSKVVAAAPSAIPASLATPSTLPVVQGDQSLVTAEARRDATVRIEQLAGGLAQGIDAVQGQLNSAYERLATAAASRAPVLDIIEITNALSEVKGQVGENSPLYEQALALRQLADSYLDLLKSF